MQVGFYLDLFECKRNLALWAIHWFSYSGQITMFLATHFSTNCWSLPSGRSTACWLVLKVSSMLKRKSEDRLWSTRQKSCWPSSTFSLPVDTATHPQVRFRRWRTRYFWLSTHVKASRRQQRHWKINGFPGKYTYIYIYIHMYIYIYIGWYGFYIYIYILRLICAY